MAADTPKSFRSSLRTTLRRAFGLPLYRFVLRLRPDSSLSPFQKFVRDGYNRRLESDLQLTSDSVVFDFGGYVGNLSWRLHKLFHPRLHIFEPVPQFVAILRQRFGGLSNVTLHPFAIGEIDRRETFGIGAAGTGAFAQAQESIEVPFSSAKTVLPDLPQAIDLAVINIEGGEYELIPALHNCGFLSKIRKMLIQFHWVGECPDAARNNCRTLLSATHDLEWSYDFIWESWRLKELKTTTL
jgi:FkbM family methyltransferase